MGLNKSVQWSTYSTQKPLQQHFDSRKAVGGSINLKTTTAK